MVLGDCTCRRTFGVGVVQKRRVHELVHAAVEPQVPRVEKEAGILKDTRFGRPNMPLQRQQRGRNVHKLSTRVGGAVLCLGLVRVHGGAACLLSKVLAAENAALEADDVVGNVDAAQETQRLGVGNNLEDRQGFLRVGRKGHGHAVLFPPDRAREAVVPAVCFAGRQIKGPAYSQDVAPVVFDHDVGVEICSSPYIQEINVNHVHAAESCVCCALYIFTAQLCITPFAAGCLVA